VVSSLFPDVTKAPGGYTARLVAEVSAPWNKVSNIGNGLVTVWNDSGTADPCGLTSHFSSCSQVQADRQLCWVEVGGFSCDPNGLPVNLGTFTLNASMCSGQFADCRCNNSCIWNCAQFADPVSSDLVIYPLTMGCAPPRPMDCGAGDQSCKECVHVDGCGGKGGTPGATPAGSPPGTTACDGGPNALLRYAGGGAGRPNTPGEDDWRTNLGIGWSHEYAMKVYFDPIVNNETDVWLVTEHATFRHFTNLAGGFPLRKYQSVAPSSETSTLYFNQNTLGWELHDLAGAVTVFDRGINLGYWKSTTDRFGNAIVGTQQNGALASVSLPDGRSEDFTYLVHSVSPSIVSGKLATITERGVGVGPGGCASQPTKCRTWRYSWSLHRLTRIDRPDGSAWSFLYEDSRFPNFMTRQILIGVGGSPQRVAGAWQLDDHGRVIAIWRGSSTAGVHGPEPNASSLERWLFTFTQFDGNGDPIETQVTDPAGVVSKHQFGRDTVSDKPRLESVSSILGDPCPFCGIEPNSTLDYDSTFPLQVAERTNGRGYTTLYGYDSHQQITSMTEAHNTPRQRLTTWVRDPTYPALVLERRLPSTSGTGDRVTSWVYLTGGHLDMKIEVGRENGSGFSLTTEYTDNTGGQLTFINPPGFEPANPDQTNLTYDPTRGNGQLILQTRQDPLVSAVTTYGYDAFNRRTSVDDPRGLRTETTYDALNRVSTVTLKGDGGAIPDQVTTYAYTALGDLDTVTRPEDNVVDYGYDGNSRLISVARKANSAAPASETTTYALNLAGNRTLETHDRGGVIDAETAYEYQTRCRVWKTIRAPLQSEQATTEQHYDCNGNLDTVWDADYASGPASQVYAYDELDRLTAVTEPWSGAGLPTAFTTYHYDVQDHLDAVTDANNNQTTYVYSDRDLMTRETSPVTSVTTHTYDAHGQPDVTTDDRGTIVDRTYDAANRPDLVDYPGTTLDVDYVYGATAGQPTNGRLTRILRGPSAVDYNYDQFGRLTQDGALGYQYDKNGRRTQLTYPGGVVATYGFDFADREQTLSVQIGAGVPQTVVAGTTYNAAGPLRALTLGNNLVETHLFDRRYVPDSITVAPSAGPALLSWDYGPTDGVGNIATIDDLLVAGGPERTYAYQPNQYFLTSGNGTGLWGTRAWTYDRIGNRISETRDGQTDTYDYVNGATDETPKLATITLAGGAGTKAYAFDAAGNLDLLTLPGGASVDTKFDAENRLEQVVHAGDGNSASVSFNYDGRGFLANLGDLYSDGLESGDLACWKPGVGGTFGGYCPGPPTYSSAGTLLAVRNQYLFYLAGRPVAQMARSGNSGAWTYLSVDHLGTPILTSSAGQAVVWQGGFEPFGRDWTSPSALSKGLFLRFPGQWEDGGWAPAASGLGLFHNLNRWYESGTGRYASADPLGLRGGNNLFRYAAANPVLLTDPQGRIAFPAAAMLACAYQEQQFARAQRTALAPVGKPFSYRWVHCYATCRIRNVCALGIPGISDVVAYQIATGKEYRDLYHCIGDYLGGGGGTSNFCQSAFQTSDFEDDAVGLFCPKADQCEEECQGLENEPDTAFGPFYDLF
jgi:RHS repeat-associated protein